MRRKLTLLETCLRLSNALSGDLPHSNDLHKISRYETRKYLCKIIMQNSTKLQLTYKSVLSLSFPVNMKVLVIVNSIVIAEIH